MALTIPVAAASLLAVAAAAHIYGTVAKKNRKTLIPPNQERVVIIGASSGIGKELALNYARRGAKVVLVARRKDLLQQVFEQAIASSGLSSSSDEELSTRSRLHIVQADMTIQQDVERIARDSLEFLGQGVDTVVLCAGVISVLQFSELAGVDSCLTSNSLVPTRAEQAMMATRKMMEVNFLAPVNLTSFFLPALIKTSLAGNLIVISSMGGKAGAPTRSIYSASKHAIQGFYDSLRMEVEHTGVHVGLMCPGTVATDLRQSAVDLVTLEAKSGPIAGSNKGAMSAAACAEMVVRGSDNRDHELVMPWPYKLTIYLQVLAPGLVRSLTKKKYGL